MIWSQGSVIIRVQQMEHLVREQALPYQPSPFLPLKLLDRNHGTRVSEEWRMEEVVNCDGTSPQEQALPYQPCPFLPIQLLVQLLREQALPHLPSPLLPLQLLDRNHGTRVSEEWRRKEDGGGCDGTSPQGTGAPISTWSVPASPAPRQESWNKRKWRRKKNGGGCELWWNISSWNRCSHISLVRSCLSSS